MEHLPILRNDVQKYLSLSPGDHVIDATLGLAGHALDILEKVGKSGTLIAFEQDGRNLLEAKARLKSHKSQVVYFHDNFRHLKTKVTGQVDAILFDLGLSSPHVDDPERGFSFKNVGPLDMRFDAREPLTAAMVVNTYPEEKLTKIFFEYGEERFSRKIAREVCTRRKINPFESTVELADFIAEIPGLAIPGKKAKRHPSTQVFQALRIEVNDELNALKEALDGSMEVLKVGGRIVIISYHSLEDRIVKQFFKELEQPKISDPAKAIYRNFDEPIVVALTKKPVIPSEGEIIENPRSRSAKLRAYKKLR